MQLCLTTSGLKTTFSSPLPRSSISRLSYHGPGSTQPAVSPRHACRIVSADSLRVPPEFKCLTVAQSMLSALLIPTVAACTVLMACAAPVEAGILSGSSGLESFSLPSIPGPEALKKIRDANIEKYKAFDENFKKSPLLQKLLKNSQDNKAKHRKEIEDKYCERGAEWGVGDCSLIGLSQADKDAFLENLRKGREGK